MRNKNGNTPAMPLDMTTDKFVAVMQVANTNSHAMPALKSMLGLTKREMFAMAAMQGLLANMGRDGSGSIPDVVASAVYAADALLDGLEFENAS